MYINRFQMICPMEKFALEFLDNEEKRARYSLK